MSSKLRSGLSVGGASASALAVQSALSFELRPEALAEVGLMGALHRQLDGLELRHGLATQRKLGPEPELAFAAKQVLLRVAQEAFHNVTKHANASHVTVTADTAVENGGEYLGMNPDPADPAAADTARRQAGEREFLDLVISDDGVGFDPTASYPGHLGLRSMYERVAGLEGWLEITSAPGEGATVRVRVPLKAQPGEARA